ncbi:MAG: hypothetical protein H7177_01710 [Rhizobacter sp.]|nr:hypothetical protein [Bacteriovorax sp.]
MIFDLFKKNPFQKLESFYIAHNHNETLAKYPWMALAINQRTISDSILTKELVLNSHFSKETPPVSFQMAELKSGIAHHVFQGKEKIYSGNMTNEMEIINTRVLFNNILDAFIEKELKTFTCAMNESEFSPRQMEAEDKAVEWMRVSFEMLIKAVLESLTNPEYLFQTTFFAGVNPKTKMNEMRLICFNLDMTFLLLEDKNLRVIIYNVKPGEKPGDQKPALSGDYSFRKREMFDQFIQLLSALSKGMHA